MLLNDFVKAPNIGHHPDTYERENEAIARDGRLDAALERLANGTYGVCIESDLPIPKERLEAIPWASQRVEFKVGGLGRR